MLRHAHFTHMHSGGRAAGIMDVDTQTPKSIYADLAIPGEEALIELLRRQRGFRQGVVHQLLKPSSDRVTPFCPHADMCGGCNWQHIAYPTQLYWKREILVQALAKYSVVTPLVPEVVPSPLLQGYRNKSEYAFLQGSTPVFGFHHRDDPHKVFACEVCFLQPPHVHQIAKEVSTLAGEQLQALQIRTTTLGDTFCLITFVQVDSIRQRDSLLIRLQQKIPQVNGWFYVMDADWFHFGGAHYLQECLDELHFTYSPLSFFQPNPLQAKALYRQVKTYAALTGSETVYDLYTGVGAIACYLAKSTKEVIGIEGNPSAIADAQRNANVNKLDHTHFITGDILQTFTPQFVENHPQAHLIVLDPPRSGTLTEIKKAILYAAPQKIIYVSCNPVSLAWDLKQLCAGGYRVTALQPFDMFPHTHHVETVCLLEKP